MTLCKVGSYISQAINASNRSHWIVALFQQAELKLALVFQNMSNPQFWAYWRYFLIPICCIQLETHEDSEVSAFLLEMNVTSEVRPPFMLPFCSANKFKGQIKAHTISLPETNYSLPETN
jgi:hypothetical protein